jgi:RNA polymerase sigma-70 factor (ECF subfamily)
MHPDDSVWRERGLRSAVLAGDERAWQTWYEESYGQLRAYVAWRCAGLPDLTDEVVQETWLTAVRRIRAFDPVCGPFAAWLRGIAANVLRNQLRRRQQFACHNRPLNGTAAPHSPAERPLESRDRAEQIARALAALPDRYEAVLRAKYLEQQGVAQIAAAWNETPKAIESLLTRARQAFREVFQQQE